VLTLKPPIRYTQNIEIRNIERAKFISSFLTKPKDNRIETARDHLHGRKGFWHSGALSNGNIVENFQPQEPNHKNSEPAKPIIRSESKSETLNRRSVSWRDTNPDNKLSDIILIPKPPQNKTVSPTW
jgi:hypothetical protein